MAQRSAVTTTVPDVVAQAAARAGLGEFQRVFLPKRRSTVGAIGLFLLKLISSIMAVGALLLSGGVALASSNGSRSIAARRVYLFDGGFVVLEREDDPQAYGWDGVAAVFQELVGPQEPGVGVGGYGKYTVTSGDGRTVVLTPFWDGIAELGPYINKRVSDALRPGAYAAIDRGQGVRFGDFTLTSAGLSAGKGRLASWTGVAEVFSRNGYVKVRLVGKRLTWFTTKSVAVPNLPLFLELVESLRTGRRLS